MEKKKVKTSQKILIIVLLIILAILLNFTRKYVIIRKIMNKAKEYSAETNYYVKAYQYQVDGYIVTDSFTKDDKFIIKRNFYRPEKAGALLEMIDVKNGTEYSMYMTLIDDSGNIIKNATLNTNGYNQAPFSTGFEDMVTWQFVWFIMCSKVDTDVVNGIDCYKIQTTDMLDPTVLINRLTGKDMWGKMKNIMYFDKETGLRVREEFTSGYRDNETGDITAYDNVCDRFYEFGTVTDLDLIPPDISEYNVSTNDINATESNMPEGAEPEYPPLEDDTETNS